MRYRTGRGTGYGPNRGGGDPRHREPSGPRSPPDRYVGNRPMDLGGSGWGWVLPMGLSRPLFRGPVERGTDTTTDREPGLSRDDPRVRGRGGGTEGSVLRNKRGRSSYLGSEVPHEDRLESKTLPGSPKVKGHVPSHPTRVFPFVLRPWCPVHTDLPKTGGARLGP